MSTLLERRGAGAWLEEPGFGVYVHVPFCRHRCHYCDFNTYAGLEGLFEPYARALAAEIERAGSYPGPATSVFFGGGTPSLLQPATLGAILDRIDAVIGLAPEAEVTVEANPETVDEGYFEDLLGRGFNRVSIGVQSLAPRVLVGLGREHSAQRALEALGAARRAGVPSLNADVIYGSPWETDAEWSATLDGVVAAEPDHVSAYALTVEEGTPLQTLAVTGRIADVDPDLQAARFKMAERRLGASGYRRYEVSNWARPGHASRHNLLYWSAGNYVGFGAGAHSHYDGRRWWSRRLPRDFIDAVMRGEPTEAGGEELGLDARAGEALMLGLRLSSGVDLEGFRRRFGEAALAARRRAIDELAGTGLLEIERATLRVPPERSLVSDEVARRLL